MPRERTARAEGSPGPSRGNAVDVLLDAEQFEEMAAAVRSAERSVDLMQLLFPPGFVAAWTDDPVNPEPQARLALTLMHASRRGAHVRLLLNENALIRDSVDELKEFFVDTHESGVEVRGFPMSPNVMHAKVLVVDGREAFIIGPTFEQRFWDTSAHLPHDARRQAERGTHDTTTRIRGPAVADVAAFFERLWDMRGEDEREAPSPPPRAGDQSLQIVRTLPRRTFRDAPDGERGILDAYLDAIENAERFIYIENQYFTNETITRALARALEEKPALELVIVLNHEVDIPTYTKWQKVRLGELGYPGHPRIGVFTLWMPGADDGRLSRLHRLYVHSKLAVVDDAWATTGTANLDSVSLEDATEFGVPIDADVDINAVLLDGIGDHPRTGITSALRRRLWGEHLGLHPDDVDEAARDVGGPLALWRRVADKNLADATEGKPTMRGHALPYMPGVPLPAPLAPKELGFIA